jgi:hypothetical protein
MRKIVKYEITMFLPQHFQLQAQIIFTFLKLAKTNSYVCLSPNVRPKLLLQNLQTTKNIEFLPATLNA